MGDRTRHDPAWNARLARLAHVAALLRDRETARLAECRREAAALSAEAQALRHTHADPDPTAFNRAGRERARQVWRATELRRINTRLAELRAQEVDLAERAARAFARAQVLERLSRQGRGGPRPPA